jgi:transcriptional regulator with XRE-family HTH domain
MALIAIHPGEHLAEELKELGMSAAELARQLSVPTNRVTGILNGRRARDYRRHSLAPRPLLRHERGVLAKSPGPV